MAAEQEQGGQGHPSVERLGATALRHQNTVVPGNVSRRIQHLRPRRGECRLDEIAPAILVPRTPLCRRVRRIGLASLRTGGAVGSIMVFLAMIVTTCAAIVAFVGRYSSQAFAIGFLIPVLAYAAAVLTVGKSELDPYAGQLPTSKLLRPMFGVMAEKIWINAMTGQVVPGYDPATDPNRAGAGGGMFGSPMGLSESPDRGTFMSLGHVLIAMMFGYAGAKFAVIVHRRQRELQPTS